VLRRSVLVEVFGSLRNVPAGELGPGPPPPPPGGLKFKLKLKAKPAIGDKDEAAAAAPAAPPRERWVRAWGVSTAPAWLVPAVASAHVRGLMHHVIGT
jgi:hypothetical protein